MADVEITRGVSGNLYVEKPGTVRWIWHLETEVSHEPFIEKISLITPEGFPVYTKRLFLEKEMEWKFESELFMIACKLVQKRNTPMHKTMQSSFNIENTKTK